MGNIKRYLKQKGVLLQEEYHLCCYDPAMWLEKKTVTDILDLINGEKSLLEYWSHKPEGNGPWSWPLSLLSPIQVDILKKRFWKIKNVEIYQVENIDLTPLLNNTNYYINYLTNTQQLYIYYPSAKEYYLHYFIDDLKSIADFYELLEDYFGRFILLDVDNNNIFVPSTAGGYGSYSLAYDNLGKKGCRNYSCVLKCPVFPLDDHLKKLTFKIELLENSLTSEVTDIIIYDINNRCLAKVNEDGEFEEV